MYNINEFKKIKSPLLKEWANVKREEVQALFDFKHNIQDFLIFEAGEGLKSYENAGTAQNDRISAIFGLPYVSAGSEFAGLWNTNTQARAKYGTTPLYFRAIARAENGQTVLVFYNNKEDYYFFYDFDFYNYQEQEKQKENARRWCEFVKDCNKIKNTTIEILKKYTGKKYGEKTRQAIAQEINNRAREILQKEYNAGAWLEVKSATYQYLNISAGANYSNYFYFKFIDINNNIITPCEQVGDSLKNKAEYNASAEFNAAAKLADKIHKKAGELLPLLEEFNKHTNNINARPEATSSVYKLDIDKLANKKDFWRW